MSSVRIVFASTSRVTTSVSAVLIGTTLLLLEPPSLLWSAVKSNTAKIRPNTTAATIISRFLPSGAVPDAATACAMLFLLYPQRFSIQRAG